MFLIFFDDFASFLNEKKILIKTEKIYTTTQPPHPPAMTHLCVPTVFALKWDNTVIVVV